MLGATIDAPTSGAYYVRVCATSVANRTTCVTSDRFVLDITPPQPPTLCVLPASQSDTGARGSVCGVQSSAFWVGALAPPRIGWSMCEDGESPVRGFRWRSTTAADGVEVTPWTPIGLATSAAVPAPIVESGVEILFTVACINRAGLASEAVLGPLRFDALPMAASPGADVIELRGLVEHSGVWWSGTSSIMELAVAPYLIVHRSPLVVDVELRRMDTNDVVLSRQVFGHARAYATHNPACATLRAPMRLPTSWCVPSLVR